MARVPHCSPAATPAHNSHLLFHLLCRGRSVQRLLRFTLRAASTRRLPTHDGWCLLLPTAHTYRLPTLLPAVTCTPPVCVVVRGVTLASLPFAAPCLPCWRDFFLPCTTPAAPRLRAHLAPRLPAAYATSTTAAHAHAASYTHHWHHLYRTATTPFYRCAVAGGVRTLCAYAGRRSGGRRSSGGVACRAALLHLPRSRTALHHHDMVYRTPPHHACARAHHSRSVPVGGGWVLDV